MADTTLRSLAKAYAKKNLEQAAYREARAKLINNILSGEITLTVNDYPPLIRPKADTSKEATLRRQEKKKQPLTETKQQKPPAQPQPVKNNNRVLAGGAIAAVVIVILVIIGVLVSHGYHDKATVAGSEDTTASTPANPDEAQLLIRDFLAQRNWATDLNLDAFLMKWQALPADTRNNAMTTLELKQLTNAINKLLVEERALSAIGNTENASSRQMKLIEFARQIGINDPRIAP